MHAHYLWRIFENASFWTLIKVNLGAGSVDKRIVLVQSIHSQNNIVIPNICDIKLYKLLVVGLAVSVVL